MATPSITQLPDAPKRTDLPQTFANKADAFVAALPTLVSETNTAIDWENTTFTQVQTEASNAATSATLSEDWATSTTAVSGGLKGSRGYAQDAETSANASAASANYKGLWSSLTGSLNIPASVGHNGTVWVLNTNLADVTTSEPGVSGDWTYAYYPPIAGQAGKVLKASAGSAGVEWAEGLLSEYQVFTTSGTFAKDPNAKWIYVEAVGGGGGGANTTGAAGNTESVGGSGGIGIAAVFRADDVPASVSVTVGSGGSGGANGTSSVGSKGGDSSFGSLVLAKGGAAQIGTSTNIVDTFSLYSASREDGGNSYGQGVGGRNSTGGNAVFGGGGGGPSVEASSQGLSGGESLMFGDGGGGSFSSGVPGGNGGFPGGGGGGSQNDGGGGDGGDGRIRIWQW